MTALHGAAFHKSVDVVNILLTKDSSLISQTDQVSENYICPVAATYNGDVIKPVKINHLSANYT